MTDGPDCIPADDVFWECLVGSREVCSHCFRVVRAVVPGAPANARKSVREIATDRSRAAGAGEFSHVPPSFDDRGNVARRSSYRVVCGACGRVDGADGDPKPTGRVVRDMARCLDRLDEQRVSDRAASTAVSGRCIPPVEADVVFDSVRAQKSQSARQGDDWQVMATALAAGVFAADESA